MQLVLCNNRVMAHGEGFLSMGGVVIHPETGAKYEGATIAECDSCPSDLGQVGYEYRAGVFTPCAPYGKGNGTIPVLCDDECKAIKDSGIPLESFCLVEKKTYTGNGGIRTIDFTYPPFMVFIKGKDSGHKYFGTIIGDRLFVTHYTDDSHYEQTVTVKGSSITLSGQEQNMNKYNSIYEATALCIKGGVTDV